MRIGVSDLTFLIGALVVTLLSMLVTRGHSLISDPVCICILLASTNLW